MEELNNAEVIGCEEPTKNNKLFEILKKNGSGTDTYYCFYFYYYRYGNINPRIPVKQKLVEHSASDINDRCERSRHDDADSDG